MSAVAAPTNRNLADVQLRRDVDEFLELIVCDLPYGDIAGRLERLGYVRDRLNLAFSKDAARLSAEFREEETADRLDAPTSGEWIRHNCKMKSGAAYDCINVGKQLPRIAKCAQAMATVRLASRTYQLLRARRPHSRTPLPNLSSRRMTSSSTPGDRQPDGSGITANACATRSTQKAWSRIIASRSRSDVCS
jgi:hypothetical protein